MRLLLCLMSAGLIAGLSTRVTAQHTAAPDASPEVPLDEIVVTGEYPGPGLWKVTRAGDTSGHAMWIVGDPGLLPKGLKWKSAEFEATVLSSQEILYDAGVHLAPDEKVGLWRALSLAPAALKARRNPDDATLKDVLPPELYARWLVQKKLYLGRDSGVENWRPLFAANKLQDSFFETLELSPKETVFNKVHALAAQRKIKQTRPELKFTFKRDEIRGRLKDFLREPLADVDCMAVTLDLAEALGRRDIENARHRAWARGDLAAYKALPELPNPDLPCTMAVINSDAARDLVPADVEQQVIAKWFEAVDASLAANQSTFAVVSFSKLVRKDGYLDQLRAKGYVVQDPADEAPVAAAPPD